LSQGSGQARAQDKGASDFFSLLLGATTRTHRLPGGRESRAGTAQRNGGVIFPELHAGEAASERLIPVASRRSIPDAASGRQGVPRVEGSPLLSQAGRGGGDTNRPLGGNALAGKSAVCF
jgi:hypothetical protein